MIVMDNRQKSVIDIVCRLISSIDFYRLTTPDVIHQPELLIVLNVLLIASSK